MDWLWELDQLILKLTWTKSHARMPGKSEIRRALGLPDRKCQELGRVGDLTLLTSQQATRQFHDAGGRGEPPPPVIPSVRQVALSGRDPALRKPTSFVMGGTTPALCFRETPPLSSRAALLYTYPWKLAQNKGVFSSKDGQKMQWPKDHCLPTDIYNLYN